MIISSCFVALSSLLIFNVVFVQRVSSDKYANPWSEAYLDSEQNHGHASAISVGEKHHSSSTNKGTQHVQESTVAQKQGQWLIFDKPEDQLHNVYDGNAARNELNALSANLLDLLDELNIPRSGINDVARLSAETQARIQLHYQKSIEPLRSSFERLMKQLKSQAQFSDSEKKHDAAWLSRNRRIWAEIAVCGGHLDLLYKLQKLAKAPVLDSTGGAFRKRDILMKKRDILMENYTAIYPYTGYPKHRAPLVSVIVADFEHGTHEPSAGINRILKRIHKQEYTNFEVIIAVSVWGKRTCGSWYAVMSDIYKNTTRFACLPLAARGPLPRVGELRNFAAIEARGDYVVLWDDGQYYSKRRIALQMEHAWRSEKHDAMAALLFDYILDVSVDPALLYRVLEPVHCGACYATVLFKRSILNGGGVEFDPRIDNVNVGGFVHRAVQKGHHLKADTLRWMFFKHESGWSKGNFPHLADDEERQQKLEMLSEFPRAWVKSEDVDSFVKDLLFHLGETEPLLKGVVKPQGHHTNLVFEGRPKEADEQIIEKRDH